MENYNSPYYLFFLINPNAISTIPNIITIASQMLMWPLIIMNIVPRIISAIPVIIDIFHCSIHITFLNFISIN